VIKLLNDVKVPLNTDAPFRVDVPATYKLPKPAPPATCRAPVVVDDEPSVNVVIKLLDDVKIPFIVDVPFNVEFPATNKLPIPAPPAICNAPVVDQLLTTLILLNHRMFSLRKLFGLDL
jgi:hypothetical protein